MNGLSPAGGSVRAYLVGYHDRLEASMRRVVAACLASDVGELQDAWTSFEGALRSHIDVEDRIVIPLLGPKSAREARALFSEHRHLRARLDELRPRATGGTLRVEVARSLMDELRAHNRHETDVLYEYFDLAEPIEGRRAMLEALAKALAAA